jgi:hypothetical protein
MENERGGKWKKRINIDWETDTRKRIYKYEGKEINKMKKNTSCFTTLVSRMEGWLKIGEL